jgi:putative transcriptional regulator
MKGAAPREVTDGFVGSVPQSVDVKSIRKRLGLTQHDFALRFGFNEATIRDWEQGRHNPSGHARVLLLVINHDPNAVMAALNN